MGFLLFLLLFHRSLLSPYDPIVTSGINGYLRYPLLIPGLFTISGPCGPDPVFSFLSSSSYEFTLLIRISSALPTESIIPVIGLSGRSPDYSIGMYCIYPFGPPSPLGNQPIFPQERRKNDGVVENPCPHLGRLGPNLGYAERRGGKEEVSEEGQ